MATVMLVTNETNGGHDLAAVLRHSGHDVLAEADGQSALRAMEHEDVDLLAADAVLPDMLGTDLIVLARIHLGRPHLPAVLLSSAPRDVLQDAADVDEVPMLATPLSGQQLVDTIADIGLVAGDTDRRRASQNAPQGRRRQAAGVRVDVARRTTNGSDGG